MRHDVTKNKQDFIKKMPITCFASLARNTVRYINLRKNRHHFSGKNL